MATYKNITRQEMEYFLLSQGFRLVQLPGTLELVYGKRVDQGHMALTLRVYTGIVEEESRDVGDDAIRVNLFLRLPDGKVVKVGGSKRVHRVQGWKKNLQARLDGWLDYLPKDACPKCGLPMVPREGRNGKFLGCVGYPQCKFTRTIKEEPHRKAS